MWPPPPQPRTLKFHIYCGIFQISYSKYITPIYTHTHTHRAISGLNTSSFWKTKNNNKTSENHGRGTSKCQLWDLCASTVWVSVPGTSKDGEDEQEDVDDVQVEIQRGKHVLLRRDGILVLPAHHELGVEHQILSNRHKILYCTSVRVPQVANAENLSQYDPGCWTGCKNPNSDFTVQVPSLTR